VFVIDVENAANVSFSIRGTNDRRDSQLTNFFLVQLEVDWHAVREELERHRREVLVELLDALDPVASPDLENFPVKPGKKKKTHSVMVTSLG
jgi:hypothetical protein